MLSNIVDFETTFENFETEVTDDSWFVFPFTELL